MRALRIVDWEVHFENNRSRGRQNLHWVPIPNKHDGDGYTELIGHANGVAHFGAWVLLVQVASKCRPRGVLLRDGNRPYNEQSLERVTRCPAQVFAEAIPRLIKIGWLEQAEINAAPECQASDTTAAPEWPPGRHLSVHRTEQKGTEGNGTEGAATAAPGRTPLPIPPESHSAPPLRDKGRSCGHAAFDRFWEKYRRKVGKDMACQVWISLNLDAIADQVMAGLDRWLNSEEWKKENGKFIPSPAKWLSGKRWLDEPKPADDDLPEYWQK